MLQNLRKTQVIAESEAHGKAQVGPKKAQVRPKMAQDRMKMAKMGGDKRKVSGRWLKMRSMSSKMRLKIVKMRFRIDFRGHDEKSSAWRGPAWRRARPCSRLRLSGV